MGSCTQPLFAAPGGAALVPLEASTTSWILEILDVRTCGQSARGARGALTAVHSKRGHTPYYSHHQRDRGAYGAAGAIWSSGAVCSAVSERAVVVRAVVSWSRAGGMLDFGMRAGEGSSSATASPLGSQPGGCLLQLLRKRGVAEARPFREQARGCLERRRTAYLDDTESCVQQEVLRGAVAHLARPKDTVPYAPVPRAAGSCSGLATRRRGQL